MAGYYLAGWLGWGRVEVVIPWLFPWRGAEWVKKTDHPEGGPLPMGEGRGSVERQEGRDAEQQAGDDDDVGRPLVLVQRRHLIDQVGRDEAPTMPKMGLQMEVKLSTGALSTMAPRRAAR